MPTKNIPLPQRVRELAEQVGTPETWCEVCESTANECGCTPDPRTRFIQATSVIIRTAMLEALPKWISVKERLPEADERVLAFRSNDYQRVEIEFYYKQDRWSSGFYHDGEQDTNVTHWMPLPESPAAIASLTSDLKAETQKGT